MLYLKHHPVFTLKRNILGTAFCLHLQVKPTQLGRIYRSSPYLLSYSETGTCSIDWANLSRFHLKTETESALHNVTFKKKTD
jgi:hypothetical protein